VVLIARLKCSRWELEVWNLSLAAGCSLYWYWLFLCLLFWRRFIYASWFEYRLPPDAPGWLVHPLSGDSLFRCRTEWVDYLFILENVHCKWKLVWYSVLVCYIANVSYGGITILRNYWGFGLCSSSGILKKSKELIAYIPRYDTGHLEDDTSNNSPIVACVFVTAVTFLLSLCLARGLLPSPYLATKGGFLLSRCLATKGDF
jgi:hypothetical protein